MPGSRMDMEGSPRIMFNSNNEDEPPIGSPCLRLELGGFFATPRYPRAPRSARGAAGGWGHHHPGDRPLPGRLREAARAPSSERVARSCAGGNLDGSGLRYMPRSQNDCGWTKFSSRTSLNTWLKPDRLNGICKGNHHYA